MDSVSCISIVDVHMQFYAPFIPQPHVGGTIDQYEIIHCWKPNGQSCDNYSGYIGYVNNPVSPYTYGMHVPCDAKAHYYMFRAREKVGPPPTGGRYSHSRYRTYDARHYEMRICMSSPDMCTDCASPPCPGDARPSCQYG